MALQLNLGRIQPIKKPWATGVDYEPLDFVEYYSNYYACVAAHTASSLNRPGTGTEWELLAGGFEYIGNWQAQPYEPGSVVSYNGSSYYTAVPVTAATGAPGVAVEWVLLASGIGRFIGAYSSIQTYDSGDYVTYRGSFYRANQAILATETPNAQPTKWDVVASGFNGPNIYEFVAGDNVEYEVNDIIRFRNSVYIVLQNCNSSTNNPSATPSLFDTLIVADNHVGAWASSTTYYENDVVSFGNGLWRCIAYAASQSNPRTATGYWEKIFSGVNSRGAWSTSAGDYYVGDIVTLSGISYICTADHTVSQSERPTATTQTSWDILSGGFDFQGAWSQGDYDIGDVVIYDQSSWVANRTILITESQPPTTNTGWDLMVKGYPSTDAITYAIALG